MSGIRDALTKELVSLPLPSDTTFEIVTFLEMIGMMSVFLAVIWNLSPKHEKEKSLNKINLKAYCNFIFSDRGKMPYVVVYVVLRVF